MADQLKEGRDLFKASVTDEIFKLNIYDRALIDRLIKPRAHLKSKMW